MSAAKYRSQTTRMPSLLAYLSTTTTCETSVRMSRCFSSGTTNRPKTHPSGFAGPRIDN